MIKKGTVVTLIFIISTFIQLASQIVITKMFGASFQLDVFLAAVAVPTILVTVIYSTLNDAILPLYSHKRQQDENKADNYFLSGLIILMFFSSITAWILSLNAQYIAEIFYASRGATFVKEVGIQMSYLFYSVPLSIVAALLGAYFYSRKNFIRFPFAQLIGSGAHLAFIIMLAPSLGIWALVFAFVFSLIIQIFIIIPREILKFRFVPINLTPLILAWIPLIISVAALRSDTLLIRSFGSELPTGSLTYLNLISRIFSLATGVMTIGIQILLLPHLVEYIAKKEFTHVIQNVNKAKVIAVFLAVIVTMAIMLIAPVVIHILFVGGKFTSQDAATAVSFLPLFLLPAIGWGINGVFFQPLIAIGKQIPLGILNVVALILGWTIGGVMKEQFGVLTGITSGLIVLLFTGIIGSEILWQLYKRKLLTTTK